MEVIALTNVQKTVRTDVTEQRDTVCHVNLGSLMTNAKVVVH